MAKSVLFTITAVNDAPVLDNADAWTVTGIDMYATPGGNVGIGVAAPRRRLELMGDGTEGGLRLGTQGYRTGSVAHLAGGKPAGSG